MSQSKQEARRGGCLRAIGWVALVLLLLLVAGVAFWVQSTNRTLGASERFAAGDGAPGSFVEVDGRQIHYQLLGNPDGQPLLFVHGFNVNGGYEWSEIAPYLEEKYFLIIPDLPPFGHSERIGETSPLYTVQGQANALVTLLDSLNVKQADVVAASAGGAAAVQMALDYPERVERLVLIGAELYDSGGGIFAQLGALPFGIGRANTWTGLGAGPRSGALFAIGCRTNGYCPDQETIERRQHLAEIQGTTDAIMARNSTLPASRVPADLAQVQQPVLLIWGGGDLRGIETANRLAAELPNATVEIVAEADHTPHLHKPAATALLIDNFLMQRS